MFSRLLIIISRPFLHPFSVATSSQPCHRAASFGQLLFKRCPAIQEVNAELRISHCVVPSLRGRPGLSRPQLVPALRLPPRHHDLVVHPPFVENHIRRRNFLQPMVQAWSFSFTNAGWGTLTILTHPFDGCQWLFSGTYYIISLKYSNVKFKIATWCRIMSKKTAGKRDPKCFGLTQHK